MNFSHLVVDFKTGVSYIEIMIKRNITPLLLDALSDTPVVFLAGARQTGKSTLVLQIAKEKFNAQYITLDDYNFLSAAKNDPQGFIAGLPDHVIIDEIQRAPELFLPIKASVDKRRMPGRFLLTGSANVLLIPKLSESLAGRMEVQILCPLSRGELLNVKENFIDTMFTSPGIPTIPHFISQTDLWENVCIGGYPEVVGRSDPQRRKAWFKSYLTTVLQRDIRDLSNIEGISQLPDILHFLAGRCANLINFADVSRSLQIPQTSIKRYISLLESTFLIYRLLPWSGNFNSRLTKAAKIYLSDTGLVSFLLDVDGKRLKNDQKLAGPIFENYVVNELLKQAAWSASQPRAYHFRTLPGREVDILLEDARGRFIGIEVKTSAAVDADAAKGLRFLKESFKSKFIRGIVLYTGKDVVPFDENIHAVPVEMLWSILGTPRGKEHKAR
jgi:predicted AAA+ superfamily ATPase